MQQPDFDHHKKCYELLKQVWHDPEQARNIGWQNRVLGLLGPSDNEEALRYGDEVELLVDGFRGKFKGHIGVVMHSDGFGGLSIRVPGKIAPGEDREYQGPYLRNQLKLVKRAPRP